MRARLFLVLVLVLSLGWVQPVSAAEIFRNWYDTQPDGSVIQTIMIKAPQTIKLDFNPCNVPLPSGYHINSGCGDSSHPEFDCFVFKWNPTFANDSIESLTISPPPGASGRKVFLRSGSLPGFVSGMGYYGPDNKNDWNSNILDGAPTFNRDGGVTLDFKTPGFMKGFTRSTTGSGMICGISNEAYEQFKKDWGETNDENFYNSYIRVTIVWTKPDGRLGIEAVPQTINLNGHPNTVNADIGPARQNRQLPAATPYQQNDRSRSATTFTNSTFGETGTVPTTIASMLSQFGQQTDPTAVGKQLTERGITTDAGTDWQQLQGYLSSDFKLTTANTSFAGAVQSLQRGDAVVAGYTTPSGNQSSLLLTGYDAQKDRFQTVDPTRGSTTITTTQLLKGQPWMMTVSR